MRSDLGINHNQDPANSSQTELILSIDLGTSGCKCALVDLHDNIHDWAFEKVNTSYIGQEGAEQEPDDWWQALKLAVRKMRNSDNPARKIVAVCASTQGEGTVAVSEDGDPLCPAMLWLDMRGRKAIRKAAGGALKIGGYSPRKLAKWIRYTGGAPSLSGKDPAGHMVWLKQERPDLYDKTFKFLNVLDFLNFRLTGNMLATPDSILTSWVTDNRNLRQIDYRDDLVNFIGIDRHRLPEIVAAADVIGQVTEKVANELDKPSGIPVVAGGIDTSVAAIGSGAIADGALHLYVGTSSWMCAHVPQKKTNLFTQIASVPCAIPDRYLMIAMQSAAGANLAFLRDHLFLHNDELMSHDEDRNVYQILDSIADKVDPGSRGVLYAPWLFGERTPVDDPSLRAAFVNLSMAHTREDMIRAVLEGVALNTRWMFQSVKRFLSNYPIDRITIVGGGGASNVWCQIFADVLGVTIMQPQSPLQVNVLGSARIAAVGSGRRKFADYESAQIAKQYHPNSDNQQTYDQCYDRFMTLHRYLKPFYQRVNGSKPHRAI